MVIAQADWSQTCNSLVAAGGFALALYAAARTYYRSVSDSRKKREDEIARRAAFGVEVDQKKKQQEEEVRRVARIADAMQPSLDKQTCTLTDSIHSAVNGARVEFKRDFEMLDQRLSKVEANGDALSIIKELRAHFEAMSKAVQKTE